MLYSPFSFSNAILRNYFFFPLFFIFIFQFGVIRFIRGEETPIAYSNLAIGESRVAYTRRRKVFDALLFFVLTDDREGTEGLESIATKQHDNI